MTHWKRVIVYPWLLILLLLSAAWASTKYSRTSVVIDTLGLYAVTTVQQGNLNLYSRGSDNPASDVQLLRTTETWDFDLLGSFSFEGSIRSFDVSIPLYFLILVHTAFFTLLYLILHRHYRKKATALPQGSVGVPPASQPQSQ